MAVRQNIIIPLGFLLALLLVQPAWALNAQFTTYGGFDPIAQAFQRIALIFSDGGYKGLFFTITVLGIVSAATAWTVKMATGVRIIPLAWTVPVLIGVVIYLGMFVPKGNITVYDAVLNRFVTIGGIPNAIVATAGILNKIEEGIISIIDTAGIPGARFTDNAGGIGFSILRKVDTVEPKNAFVKASLSRYIKDCVAFELVRPGTTLTLDTLRDGTSDFLNDLAQAVHPLIYTVYYDAANPQGVSMTCTDAWNNLQPILSNLNFYSNAVKSLCGKSSFDPADALDIATCKNILSNTLAVTTGTGTTPEKMIQQRWIAELLYDYFFRSDWRVSTLMEANRSITTSGMGIGLTMNAWIPVMRAVMTAVAIGLIPFLTLFLPTPLSGKALSVMLGFFVFLTTWGITDAVLHNALMDHAVKAFEDIRQSNLGVYACAAFPEVSTRMLAMFGMVRSAGIMLASFLSMMLIRFGGHALAMLAGRLSGTVQAAGAQAGQAALSPEGTANTLTREARAGGLLAAIPEHRYANIATAETWSFHKRVGGAAAEMSAVSAAVAAGRLPADLSNADLARAVAAGRGTSIGTDSGPLTVTTGPGGEMSLMAGQTAVSHGFVRSETIGADGTGKATEKGGAGSIEYAVDNGEYTVQAASVNGLNPVKVATTAQTQRIKAASERLASGENYKKLLDRVARDSVTDEEARRFGEQLKNIEQSKWGREISEGSGFKFIKDETVRQQLQAFAEAGGGWDFLVKLKGGGKAVVSVIGDNGEKVSFDISEKEAQALSRTRDRIRSESIEEALRSSHSLDYASRLAKDIGAEQAQSYLEEAKFLEASRQEYGADLTTAMVVDYAVNRWGDDSPENIRRAVEHFNFLARTGEGGMLHLKQHIEGFLSGKGYGWGATDDQVHRTIHSTQERLQAKRAALQEQVEPAAGQAAARTQEAPRREPTGDTSLREPDSASVQWKADRMRNELERERQGKGRVQTALPGMVSEMLWQHNEPLTSPFGKEEGPFARSKAELAPAETSDVPDMASHAPTTDTHAGNQEIPAPLRQAVRRMVNSDVLSVDGGLRDAGSEDNHSGQSGRSEPPPPEPIRAPEAAGDPKWKRGGVAPETPSKPVSAGAVDVRGGAPEYQAKISGGFVESAIPKNIKLRSSH